MWRVGSALRTLNCEQFFIVFHFSTKLSSLVWHSFQIQQTTHISSFPKYTANTDSSRYLQFSSLCPGYHFSSAPPGDSGSAFCQTHSPSSLGRTKHSHLCSHNALHVTSLQNVRCIGSPLAISFPSLEAIPLHTAFLISWFSLQSRSIFSSFVRIQVVSVIHISYTRKMQCALIIVCCFSKKMWLPKPNRQCPWPLNEMFQRTTVLKMPPCTEELLWEWNLVDEDKQLSTDVYSQHIWHQILHVFSNTTSPTLQHQLGISYNSIHFWPYSIRSYNIRTQSYKTVPNSNTSPRLSTILLNSQL